MVNAKKCLVPLTGPRKLSHPLCELVCLSVEASGLDELDRGEPATCRGV